MRGHIVTTIHDRQITLENTIPYVIEGKILHRVKELTIS
jgi:hypothetical protein